ncbi:hypothetical protein Avbf_10440 [Armadillidium vulgare]|nr:hypothetical protein Avbf_10440 [Armadillidium vulgare]
MRNFHTPASIDSTKVYYKNYNCIVSFDTTAFNDLKSIVFKYDENSYLQEGEGEGEDDGIMIPSKEEDQATFSTVPLGNKDFKLFFSSDNKASNFFLNEPLSYEIQERILMEDSHRSSELSDPHIPIEKFSEKMQLELITDMNRSSSEQDYTGNKNNGHEDNTKEVSNCNTKYNLSTSNNFKCGDGASCKTCSNSFHCKRKVRFNLKCKQEKRTKRKTKPVSIPVRNCLLTKRCTNRYSSFKRKPKKNMVSCDVNQKADSVGKSNYNRVETAINDMPKRTSCTLTKLQCPKEVREVEVSLALKSSFSLYSCFFFLQVLRFSSTFLILFLFILTFFFFGLFYL